MVRLAPSYAIAKLEAGLVENKLGTGGSNIPTQVMNDNQFFKIYFLLLVMSTGCTCSQNKSIKIDTLQWGEVKNTLMSEGYLQGLSQIKTNAIVNSIRKADPYLYFHDNKKLLKKEKYPDFDFKLLKPRKEKKNYLFDYCEVYTNKEGKMIALFLKSCDGINVNMYFNYFNEYTLARVTFKGYDYNGYGPEEYPSSKLWFLFDKNTPLIFAFGSKYGSDFDIENFLLLDYSLFPIYRLYIFGTLEAYSDFIYTPSGLLHQQQYKYNPEFKLTDKTKFGELTDIFLSKKLEGSRYIPGTFSENLNKPAWTFDNGFYLAMPINN